MALEEATASRSPSLTPPSASQSVSASVTPLSADSALAGSAEAPPLRNPRPHQCVVCHEEDLFCFKTPCFPRNHYMHLNCIATWYNNGEHNSCPECRQPLVAAASENADACGHEGANIFRCWDWECDYLVCRHCCYMCVHCNRLMCEVCRYTCEDCGIRMCKDCRLVCNGCQDYKCRDSCFSQCTVADCLSTEVHNNGSGKLCNGCRRKCPHESCASYFCQVCFDAKHYELCRHDGSAISIPLPDSQSTTTSTGP